MNKKGAEIATGTIIMIIIGLVVLGVVILLLRQQATKGAKGYEDIRKQTEVSNLNNCENLVLGRYCDASCPAGKSVGGSWPDCRSKNLAACCER